MDRAYRYQHLTPPLIEKQTVFFGSYVKPWAFSSSSSSYSSFFFCCARRALFFQIVSSLEDCSICVGPKFANIGARDVHEDAVFVFQGVLWVVEQPFIDNVGALQAWAYTLGPFM